MVRLGLAVGLFVAAVALAEDAKARAAREELERQLGLLVVKAPTRVRVELAGLDEPNYVLEEATFELDGRALGAPSLKDLNREGTHLVWVGDVPPGKHTVGARLVYANAASVVLSDEGGYKWKIGGSVRFDLNSGIEVQVRVTPARDPSQADIAKRFKLSLPAKPVMLAALDDGSMPEPPPKPVLAVVDAGPSPEELAAAQRKAAEEEAKRLAEEEARRLAQAEAARKAEAEAQAKLAAAEANTRRGDAKTKGVAPPPAPVPVAEPQPVAAPEPMHAPAPSPPEPVAVVDAGAATSPAVAAAPVPAEGEGEFPWGIVLGAGLGGALVFLVLLARRRSQPPRPDE
jgi:hypothetical protein